MSGGKPSLKWRAIGRSVIGASHIRSGMPNQDAIRLPDEVEGALILAVSDGHGSSRYFRSDRGARMAVDCSVTLLKEFLKGQPDLTNLSSIKRTADERLPQELVRRWHAAVAEDLSREPLTSEELTILERKESSKARQSVERKPMLAYGATLLAVVVTEAFIFYLQLGDGDILTVSEDGEVSRPIPHDPRLMANQTTSLCADDAWRDVIVRLQAVVGKPPALILLSTDGYANSFVNEEAFLKVGSDILDIIQESGLAFVEKDLESWLTEASRAGSGDDITMGIVCRMDVPGVTWGPKETPAMLVQKPPQIHERPKAEEPVEAKKNEPAEAEESKPEEEKPVEAKPAEGKEAEANLAAAEEPAIPQPAEPASLPERGESESPAKDSGGTPGDEDSDGYPWMYPTVTQPPRIKPR